MPQDETNNNVNGDLSLPTEMFRDSFLQTIWQKQEVKVIVKKQ